MLEQIHDRFRKEHDLLGEMNVPQEAFYGIQTLRACQNFSLSGVTLSHFPRLIAALAMVKQAAALANAELGILEHSKSDAIVLATQSIINCDYQDQFVVDMIQGGAGTSTNMNANEVIANVALTLMGHEKGDYRHLHPNNDVNQSQSTNDAYPTAVRLSILLSHGDLVSSP